MELARVPGGERLDCLFIDERWFREKHGNGCQTWFDRPHPSRRERCGR